MIAVYLQLDLHDRMLQMLRFDVSVQLMNSENKGDILQLND